MSNFIYQTGPLIKETADPGFPGGYWRAPDGVFGFVDLASNPQCAQATGDSRPVAFLAADRNLGTGYDVLGTGDLREINATAAMQNAWKSAAGYKPSGDKLVDLLADHLLNGSDPTGDNACKPLVPGVALDICIGGHSRVWSQAFKWGKHGHTNRLKAALKHEAKQLQKVLREDEYRKWLGGLEHKYGTGTAADVDPKTKPKKPSTTLQETFTGSNDTGQIGSVYNWTEHADNTWQRYNNAAVVRGAQAAMDHRVAACDTALSSSDHWSQSTFSPVTGAGWGTGDVIQAGAICRVASGLASYYVAFLNRAYSATYGYRLYKSVSGTATELGSASAGSVQTIFRCTVSGSSISGYYGAGPTLDKTQTDTAIASGTSVGIYGITNESTAWYEIGTWDADDGIVAAKRNRLIGGGIL
jgi:hypothetical protein